MKILFIKMLNSDRLEKLVNYRPKCEITVFQEGFMYRCPNDAEYRIIFDEDVKEVCNEHKNKLEEKYKSDK